MSRKIRLLLLLFLLSVGFISCRKQEENVLTVYAYSSFADSWGPGNDIIRGFEEKTQIKVNLVSCGGAVEMYSRLLMEKEDTPADVVLGLSDNMDIDTNLFEIIQPFDYAYYCFLYNEKETDTVPESFSDLTKPEYKDKFILIDPRTSSVGLGLLKWTVLAMGEEDAMSWWKTAIKNALTICDSWSSAYGLFTENEAPVVLSYTTSPAYHILNEGNYSIKASEFAEGHIKTTEYAGILKTSDRKDDAKLFCDYILNEGQEKIAVSNTMFPVNTDTDIPKALSECLIPEKILNSEQFTGSQEELLDRWIKNLVD